MDGGEPEAGADGGEAGEGGVGACVPEPEACNRADDDCDGTNDEDTTAACEAIIENAVTRCVPFATSARCVLMDCLDGFANCDGLPSNGCEPYCMCNDCSDAGNDDAGN